MRGLLYFVLTLVTVPNVWSQTPAPASIETAFYSVSYIEVTPSSRAMAVAAIKQYRDASRKDDGYVAFEFFEQDGRSGHFAILETWASQKAYDTHRSAAHSQQFMSKLEPIRLSDYDQRPYKTLTVVSLTPAANPRAIYVITHVDVGGQGDAAGLLRRLAEASRKEEGNLRFDVLLHTMRSNHFTVIEAWQNQKALDAHAAAAHTRQYRDGLHPLLGSPLDERLHKVVE